MNRITVAYPIAQQEFVNVTEAEYDVVNMLYFFEKKVTAIKFLRQQYGLDLKRAKDICDAIGAIPRANRY